MEIATPSTGTLTLDLNRDTVFRVPLTANVTSVVFTGNTGRAGQTIEVHFEQDATGSRTVAGWPAAVKLAGGALTLTTTPSKVDVITLRQMDTGATKFREVRGRAMASAV